MPDANPRQVRSLLNRNNLFINEPAADKIGENVIKKAKDILQQGRGSDWTPEKAAAAAAEIRYNDRENEQTFLVGFMAALKGETRKVPQIAGDLSEQQAWVARKWTRDYLRTRWNVNFLAESVPKLSIPKDPWWKKVYDSVPRVTDPRPDIVFCIDKEAFDLPQQAILEHLQCHLAGVGAYLPFFILEAKCMDATMAEAENQACRSGSAMVKKWMDFKRAATQQGNREQPIQQEQQGQAAQQGQVELTAGPENVQGANVYEADDPPSTLARLYSSPGKYRPDPESFTYSLAVTADQAKLYVNWALELPDASIHWHASYLNMYNYRDLDAMTQLHHDIDNILDWGVGSQKNKITELLNQAPKGAVLPSPKKVPKRKWDGDKSGKG
ncbi:MAG: hypothetical protein Q9163_005046 [Psora crenata]